MGEAFKCLARNLLKQMNRNELLSQTLIWKEGSLGNPANHRKANAQNALVGRELCGRQRLLDGPTGRHQSRRSFGRAHAR